VFVPLYSFVVLPGAIITTVITAVSSSIGAYMITMFSNLLLQTHKFVLFALAIPHTMLTTGKLPIFTLIALIISIVYLFVRFEQRQSINYLYRPAVYLIVVFLIQAMTPFFQASGKVLVIDVGQGDSIFIQRPFNKGNYLIDTGGRISFPQEEWEERRSAFSIAKNVTVPYFKSTGVTKLDALFLTHGDLDHIGEALSLLEEIKVKELIIPKGFMRGELEQKIIQAAERKRVKITTVQAGDQLTFQNHSFYVVSPVDFTESKNDDSLVLWTELGGLRWLFTGDAEMDAEKKLVKNYPSLQADVVKVGHHGSKGSTSEEFLDQVKPKIALVSTGLNNRYHHPHTEVLDKLAARNISLFRTDLNGAILYHFKGKVGTFSTYAPYDKVNK
jgi:competence protein ComEC